MYTVLVMIADISLLSKRLVRTVLIFTESSDQLSRATDRVPGLPASPG
ncbi:mobilization protein, partial [Escherichia coli]|nr:mobilization protein [Escherichia coli]